MIDSKNHRGLSNLLHAAFGVSDIGMSENIFTIVLVDFLGKTQRHHPRWDAVRMSDAICRYWGIGVPCETLTRIGVSNGVGCETMRQKMNTVPRLLRKSAVLQSAYKSELRRYAECLAQTT